MFQIQKLTRENKQLKEKLRNLSSELRIAKNQIEINKSLVQKTKQQNERIVMEIKQLKRRQEQKKAQKQQIETRYFNVLRRLQDEIQERKQKYRKLQAKIAPLMDHDSVRLQVLNQVEGVHTFETDELKIKINQLKDEVLTLKRINYRLEHKLQNDKIEHQNQIRKIKEGVSKTQDEHKINALTFEMCNQIENRLMLNYQQARKQAEYYKDKYFCSQKKFIDKANNLEQQIRLLKQKCTFYERIKGKE